MDKNYFDGIVGASIRVCGVTLANLSVWHMAILEAIESPFVSEGEAGLRDIIILAKVAQCSYPDEPNLKPLFRDGWWLYRMSRDSNLAAVQMIKLRKWFDVQMSAPVLYKSIDENKKVKGTSSPTMLALVSALVSRSNETFHTVWNMRMSEARWYDVSLAEQDGVELTISYDNEEPAAETPDGAEAIELARSVLSEKQFDEWARHL